VRMAQQEEQNLMSWVQHSVARLRRCMLPAATTLSWLVKHTPCRRPPHLCWAL
jgi:hypothetical protein